MLFSKMKVRFFAIEVIHVDFSEQYFADNMRCAAAIEAKRCTCFGFWALIARSVVIDNSRLLNLITFIPSARIAAEI
jgi:hypothetical protein